ncbi:hypothetical protein [Dysgonomonas macrotermitis]|uniref:Uncharacterized protein n=1 Tax=Dysgonomonas macrotermitis TaxID=1346286 RepID=A0A1M4Y8X7_9BACT|nr:hypothetical protein [Dysgonomonas macrotermitis]SHF02099.1 hypothetical protein SAMN05444362_103104 [Dysgonomonas macrotermitis]
MIPLLITANLFKAIFAINVIALVAGVFLAKTGHIKIARILSYISLVGISICIVYMILVMLPFFA